MEGVLVRHFFNAVLLCISQNYKLDQIKQAKRWTHTKYTSKVKSNLCDQVNQLT
jgi:hypothetical protein